VAASRRRFAAASAAVLRGAGSGQDFIFIAGKEQLWNTSWSDGGRVYDVGYESQKAGQPGLEGRRLAGRVLARASGGVDSCWWPEPVEKIGQFSYPVMPKVTLLRSVRITGVRTGVTQGTVALAPLLQMLGAPDQLRREGLVSPPGQRARAALSVSPNGLSITVNMATALRQAGLSPKPGQWKWNLHYAALAGGLPPISQGRIIDVDQSDPTWKAKLDACNAGIQ
jgi:hypothetical protein